MSKIKTAINKIFYSKPITSIFNLFITKNTINIFNFIYESSPNIFAELFVRMFKQPNFDYLWKIKLPNKKTVSIKVFTNYKPSWEFSLSYKWHDRALRKAETILNNYYNSEDYYLDIGANHGLRSIYALSLNRPTILFEPNIYLRDFTEKLYKENGFSNYKIENLCLSNINGTAKFFLSENTYESTLNPSEDNENFKAIDVQVVTLDSYLLNNPIKSKIKIIKIDVEGNEIQVIEGMKHTLQNNEPTLIIEILQIENKKKLFMYFKEFGYSMYLLRNFPIIKITKIETYEEINNIPQLEHITNFLFSKEKFSFT